MPAFFPLPSPAEDLRNAPWLTARLPPAWPQPGLFHPWHGGDQHAGGDADRARRAARRRQRAGCRGRGGRGAVRDRAAIHRHRRRLLLPLRAGRRRPGRGAERLRPGAGGGQHRLVRGARHHRAREHLAAHGDHPRRHLGLGDAARRAWPQGAGRAAAAGDPLRRRGLAGAQQGRLGLGAQRGQAAPDRGGGVPAERRGAAGRATCSCRRRWRRRCGPSPRRARAASTRARSAADMVATLRAAGGLQTEADFAAGRTRGRVRRADPRGLARLRGLAVPAERLRPVRADAARHAGGVRAVGGRPAQRRAHASPSRGGAAGLPRPRCVPGRPVAGRGAGAAADSTRPTSPGWPA